MNDLISFERRTTFIEYFCDSYVSLFETLVYCVCPIGPPSVTNSQDSDSESLLQTTISPAPNSLSFGENDDRNSSTARPAPSYVSVAHAMTAQPTRPPPTAAQPTAAQLSPPSVVSQRPSAVDRKAMKALGDFLLASIAAPPIAAQPTAAQLSPPPVVSQRLSDVDWEDMQDDIDRLLQSVDFYIRTRTRFDSRSPLSYSIPLTTIVSEASLVNEFCDLLEDYPYPELPYRNLRSLIDSPAGRTKFEFTTRSADVYVSVGYLTPMQVGSEHRLFGYFQCGDDGCRNKWNSAASWTNKWQQCKRCESKCYPYDQRVLQKSTRDGSSLRPHHMARCQKCRELGELCLPDYYYAL